METLRRPRDLDDKKVVWQIERVDRYWFMYSRYGYRFVETTYWYDPVTLERKETRRTFEGNEFNHYDKPEWAKGITERRQILENY